MPLGVPMDRKLMTLSLSCSNPSITTVCLPIIGEINRAHPELEKMDLEEKGKFLLNTNETPIVNLTGKLCFVMQSIFKDLTW